MITKKFAIGFLISVVSVSVQAGEESPPVLSFNGFGSLGLTYSDEREADFASTILVPQGVGFSDDISAEVDSRLGFQLAADPSSRFSGVVQVVVEEQYDSTFSPKVEWANVKYAATRDSYVRAGRIVLPGVMASEYRKVGYALPWVRPPVEVYSLMPVTNSDGIDAGVDFRIGDYTNTIRFNVGEIDIDQPDGTRSNARNLLGITASTERGEFGAHASYLRADITVDSFDALFDGFRAFGPQGRAIAEQYEIDDETVEFLGLGAHHASGNWFVRGEAAHLWSDTIVGDRYGWYVTSGYRFGRLTPYVTLARIRTDSETSDPGLDLAGLPPPVAARGAMLNAALNGVLGMAPAQKSFSLGFRWDFRRNLALKFQYDYFDLDDGSPGVLFNEQPGFERGGNVSIVSAVVDFVF